MGADHGWNDSGCSSLYWYCWRFGISRLWCQSILFFALHATGLWLDSLNQEGDESDTYYVKVKTRGYRTLFVQQPDAVWNSAGVVKRDLEMNGQDTGALDDFFATYHCPVVKFGDPKFYAILMRHRGSVRLDAADALKDVTEADFARKQWDLWNQTVCLSLQLGVCHGDVADFNVLLDDNHPQRNFVLIDWDEAAGQPKARHPRDLSTEMKHHKALRTESQLYTDVSLRFSTAKYEINGIEKEKWDVYTEASLQGFRDAIGSNDDDMVETEARAFVAAVKAEIVSHDTDL